MSTLQKFTPIKFQVPLAAGGIALMAFNFLQNSIPHEKGLEKLSDVVFSELAPHQAVSYLPLIVLMFIFSVSNIAIILKHTKQLIRWRRSSEYHEFFNGPPTSQVTILVPLASLSMTASVILAPLAFFVPQVSENLQNMMLPALVFFGILWVLLLSFEFKLLKKWFTISLDPTKLNFVWLLDVFSFGLVSLTGTGIAALANDSTIASIAAFASIFTLIFGFLLLVSKLLFLIYIQLKSDSLPANQILPAYFILIPITCLFSYSLYRILKSNFAPTQWGMV